MAISREEAEGIVAAKVGFKIGEFSDYGLYKFRLDRRTRDGLSQRDFGPATLEEIKLWNFAVSEVMKAGGN